jgi:uncharacterized protein (UPF0297 family)
MQSSRGPPFFLSSYLKKALNAADYNNSVAAEYVGYILKGDPAFNEVVRNSIEYPTSLKWHKNIRAIEEVKQNTFALFNNYEEKKKFSNSPPTSSEVYESQLAIFDARHSHLRNEIERSYQHWQEVRKSHGEECIMWEKQEFS